MPNDTFKSIDSKAELKAHPVNSAPSSVTPNQELFQYQKEALKSETQLSTQQMELGVIGKLIGSGDNAKMAVVLLTLFFMLLSIAILVFIKDMKESSNFQTVTLLLNVVAAALGFVFGQKTK